MNHKLVLLFCGLLTLTLGGCSAGKDYWLVYKSNPETIPETTYQGYYSKDIGKTKDDVINACVLNGDLNGDKADPTCTGLHTNDSGEKPSLTDYDQAKVFVRLDEKRAEEFECIVKQTKIARDPFTAFVSPSSSKESLVIKEPFVYRCPLPLADAGGMRLDYTVKKVQQAKESTAITGKPGVVNDSIEVHTLYRFRVLVGPVYSSISDSKDRTFTAKAHAGGTSYVASDANGNPVHAAAFLKYYWKPRDVYDTKWCFQGKTSLNLLIDCLATINPIVGLGISQNPLKNVYVGGSLDILPGLDIVGGVHWSSVETLSGGFTQGQVVPNGTAIPTEQRFLPGWFVGIAVDTGVAGTWISKATTSLFK